MDNQTVIAIITIACTMISSFAGILVANRLTNYRIEQLEKKVEKHNTLVERMTVVEESCKSAHHRLDSVEREVHT